MTTSPRVGPRAADALHYIDDPFSDWLPLPSLEHTPLDPKTFPTGAPEPCDDVVSESDIFDPHDESAWPAPVESRPSRAIPIPSAHLELEPRRSSWSERVFVTTLSTIVVAALATAVRERATHPLEAQLPSAAALSATTETCALPSVVAGAVRAPEAEAVEAPSSRRELERPLAPRPRTRLPRRALVSAQAHFAGEHVLPSASRREQRSAAVAPDLSTPSLPPAQAVRAFDDGLMPPNPYAPGVRPVPVHP